MCQKSQENKLLGNNSLGGNSVEEPLFTSPVKKALWKDKCKTYLFMVNGA